MLSDPDYAEEKFIIFTEHRDTVDFLIRRLEGLGFTGQVASIHGGDALPGKGTAGRAFPPIQVRIRIKVLGSHRCSWGRYKPPVLLADGQLRHPMEPSTPGTANGPHPPLWPDPQPRSSHQPSGRGHSGRTSPPHPCLRSWTIYAPSWHPTRCSMWSDALLEGVSIKDYLERALEEGNTDSVVERIDKLLTTDRVRDVQDGDRRIFGPGGEVASKLERLNDDMEQEAYRRLPSRLRTPIRGESRTTTGPGNQGRPRGNVPTDPRATRSTRCHAAPPSKHTTRIAGSA